MCIVVFITRFQNSICHFKNEQGKTHTDLSFFQCFQKVIAWLFAVMVALRGTRNVMLDLTAIAVVPLSVSYRAGPCVAQWIMSVVITNAILLTIILFVMPCLIVWSLVKGFLSASILYCSGKEKKYAECVYDMQFIMAGH